MANTKGGNQNQQGDNDNNAQMSSGVEHITRVTVGEVKYEANRETQQILVQIGDGEQQQLEEQDIKNLEGMFQEYRGQAPQ